MFPAHEWSVDWLNLHCKRRYGVLPQPRHMEDTFGLDALYAATHNATVDGGTDSNNISTSSTLDTFPAVGGYSRLVFSNGALDGWSAGSVLPLTTRTHASRALNEGTLDNNGIVAIEMPNGAHHVDLRGADPNDTADVVSAREQELAVFGRWIKQLQQERRGAHE